jgi:diacylglycerol kinase family enzyme
MDAPCGCRAPHLAACRVCELLRQPLVIANPAAGRRRAAEVRTTLESSRARQGVARGSCMAGAPAELRRKSSEATRSGYSCVPAMGAGAAVHDVADGAAGARMVVGVLSPGSGNRPVSPRPPLFGAGD